MKKIVHKQSEKKEQEGEYSLLNVCTYLRKRLIKKKKEQKVDEKNYEQKNCAKAKSGGTNGKYGNTNANKSCM